MVCTASIIVYIENSRKSTDKPLESINVASDVAGHIEKSIVSPCMSRYIRLFTVTIRIVEKILHLQYWPKCMGVSDKI